MARDFVLTANTLDGDGVALPSPDGDNDRFLGPTHLTGGTQQVSATTTAGGTKIQVGLPTSWWTPALRGATLSGTITFNIYAFESVMTANAGIQVDLHLTDFAGNTISTIAQSNNGVELGTAAALVNWTVTPTSTTIKDGNRIRMRLYAINIGTMAAGTVTVDYASTVANTADTYFTTTETLLDYVAPPGLYLRQAVKRGAFY